MRWAVARAASTFEDTHSWLVAQRKHENISAATTLIRCYSSLRLTNTKRGAAALNARCMLCHHLFHVVNVDRQQAVHNRRRRQAVGHIARDERTNLDQRFFLGKPRKQPSRLRSLQFRKRHSNLFFFFLFITMRWTGIESLHCHFAKNEELHRSSESFGYILLGTTNIMCTTHGQSLHSSAIFFFFFFCIHLKITGNQSPKKNTLFNVRRHSRFRRLVIRATLGIERTQGAAAIALESIRFCTLHAQ